MWSTTGQSQSGRGSSTGDYSQKPYFHFSSMTERLKEGEFHVIFVSSYLRIPLDFTLYKVFTLIFKASFLQQILNYKYKIIK